MAQTIKWSRRRIVTGGAALLACPAVVLSDMVLRLRLAHGLPATHPVHRAMEHFAGLVQERSGGAIAIQLFANGELGQEVQLVDQAKAGKLDFVKASASVVERIGPAYRVFSLPFVFRDHDHWDAVVNSAIGAEILASTASDGLVGLTFYEAGARSFYGRKRIDHPDDLKDLRIRIQPSPTMVRLMQLLGAKGVQLAWDVVYSALQTGVVDGAENNISALTVGRHGEVVRYYCFDEHTMVPDVFLISAARWRSLSPAHQELMREAALLSHRRMSEMWATFEADARDAAVKKMNVTLTYPDKRPFIERAAAIKDDFAADQTVVNLIARIERA
jgi:tripartite ATP-independent transporter DctP family solute receptor